MNPKKREVKYRIYWFLGAFFCACLYFSGIFFVYTFYRKRLLKQFRTIVLMYHRIRDDGIDPDISVSIRRFDQQMAYLKENFNVVSLEKLLDNVSKNGKLTMDTAAITFDDGFKDNCSNAYPILKRHKVPATIFLVSHFVGKREDMLNPDEIRTMTTENIDFGSHTATHKILSELSIEEATKEILGSKMTIENILNDKVRFFAYPKGKATDFNHQIKTVVENSGYLAAFSTENGGIDRHSDWYELKRVGMRNYPMFVFKLRISGLLESSCIHFFRKLLGIT